MLIIIMCYYYYVFYLFLLPTTLFINLFINFLTFNCFLVKTIKILNKF